MRKASVARVHGHPPLGGSIQLNLEKKEAYIYVFIHPQALGEIDVRPSLALLGGMHRQRPGVVQVPNESSSSVNDCPECEYGVPSLSSSSSEDFSSSSIPYMPVAEYGVMPDDSQLKTPEK